MHASTPLILRKSRMRRRASTDLCGGRSAMVVPTATVACRASTDERGSQKAGQATPSMLAKEGAILGGSPHRWSEPLKWHTKLGTVSGKGNTRGEKEIFPEISANGCRTDGDLRRCR